MLTTRGNRSEPHHLGSRFPTPTSILGRRRKNEGTPRSLEQQIFDDPSDTTETHCVGPGDYIWSSNIFLSGHRFYTSSHRRDDLRARAWPTVGRVAAHGPTHALPLCMRAPRPGTTHELFAPPPQSLIRSWPSIPVYLPRKGQLCGTADAPLITWCAAERGMFWRAPKSPRENDDGAREGRWWVHGGSRPHESKRKQREHFPRSGIGGARASVRGRRTYRTGLDRSFRIAHIIPPRAVYTPSLSSQ